MSKVSTFTDYDQRTYDPTLEEKLLGWETIEAIESTGEEYQQLSMKS